MAVKTFELISKRFNELEEQLNKIPLIQNYDNRGYHIETAIWQQWATSAQNLVNGTFGKDSPQYDNFLKAYNNCHGYDHEFNALKGIFLGAKSDFDGGYFFSVETAISGEIFGDFVAMAKTALREDSKDVAAVLACAALEDTLKKFAKLNEIDVENKTMQEVVSALKSQGLVSGAQKSLLETMPKIRNLAMHANWDKIASEDVSSVIGFVEQFLLSHF